MATAVKALAALGRNDIRGTYRDPLLVMIVVAPIIWTVGVVVLTPLLTEMFAERYDFDLIPYYPLLLTVFLLLTSIIIAGGAGRIPGPGRGRRRHPVTHALQVGTSLRGK